MQEENPKIEEVFPVIYNILADFTILRKYLIE